ncbi:MAG: hypothetical protein JRI67_10660 [Deltaproteobacteria bacterium]|nr:hypothetical protein [Deltaproteobacteria bacterium]
METTNNNTIKPWYKRKTTWAGIATIATATLPVFGVPPHIVKGVLAIIGGLALIFVREAIENTKIMLILLAVMLAGCSDVRFSEDWHNRLSLCESQGQQYLQSESVEDWAAGLKTNVETLSGLYDAKNDVYLSAEYRESLMAATVLAEADWKDCQGGDPNACREGLEFTVEYIAGLLDAEAGIGGE